MLFSLVSPMRRIGSQFPQFVKRIPADLRNRAVGLRLAIPIGEETVFVTVSETMASIRVSLRTNDPSEAKIRQAHAAAHVERVFAALRAQAPVSITHRQATALAGEFYRSWADTETRDRTISVLVDVHGSTLDEQPDDDLELVFAATVAMLDAAHADDPAVLEQMFGPIINRLLLGHGIAAVDEPSRRLLVEAFWSAFRDAMELRGRNASGDYRPDPKAERFPALILPSATSVPPKVGPPVGVKLSELIAGWWKESKAAGLKPRTFESYNNTMSKLIGFLGHDDAGRVTADDVVPFKDHRLSVPHPRTGKPPSARTVKDTDLAA